MNAGDFQSIALLDGDVFPAFESMQRGLAYGDGLFETMRAHNSVVPLWSQHLRRMAEGCARLALEAPAPEVLEDERDRMLYARPAAVLKLMVWRATSANGYDPAGVRQTHRCWSVSRAPLNPRRALRTRWCELRLARQPGLAGLKTLNRLEQVIARAEWPSVAMGAPSAGGYDEGLMLDSEGYVICATAGNLFAVIDGRLCTPVLDQCGVAGVFRGWMLEDDSATGVIDVRAILREEFETASEVFVTNAVRGIRPVVAIQDTVLSIGPVCREWVRRASASGYMVAESDLT